MIPRRLLPHTVTIVEPAQTVDRDRNVIADWDNATRTSVAAWLQQDQRSEPLTGQDGRTPERERWMLVTNHPTVEAIDRIEWDGPNGLIEFEVDGPPAPIHTPTGLHHIEVQLRHVRG